MKFLKFFLVLIILVSLALFFSFKKGIVFFLSPQGKVDPQNISTKFEPTCTTAICDNQTIVVPSPQPQENIILPVVASSSAEPKRIEVDLSNQRLYAFEGESKIYDFLISSGKWGKTPTGTFHIWIKLRYTRMSGGSKALHTYYDLPNVPYVMYFYNDKVPQSAGFGLHGTYWHSNFGHPMSHGCINMKTEEAQTIYYWAKPDLQGKESIRATADNPGTEIVIYGVAPQ